MNLPDTYAGGRFNLPLKVAKLVRLAESTEYEEERKSIMVKLLNMGYFLDTVAYILWDKESVPKRVANSRYGNMHNLIERR